MRRITWVFTVLLGLGAGGAEAGQSAPAKAEVALRKPPQWDVAGSVGLLSSSPAVSEQPYGDDWYFEGRYAVSIGRYWTEHLKTELELVTSGEGERFIQRYSNVPGAPPYSYPYSIHESHTLRQVSGRLVWQFFDNAWVHPYVFGGVVYDADRVKTFIPPFAFAEASAQLTQPLYPDQRNPTPPMALAPETRTGPETLHRIGATAGFGAKVYITRNAFFNTGFVASYARPARTASIVGGFGFDF